MTNGMDKSADQSPAEIKASVRRRYAALASSPQSENGFPVGPASAKRLGYAASEIDSLPSSATDPFAGVGNPFSLGDLQPGQVVLDLGCGAGMDTLLAARKVAPGGRAVGLDMTPEMVLQARDNALLAGLANAEFHQGDIEALPLADQSVDVILSNGVFNLCPDKPRVLAEAFRVLRPGGRLLMADILLEDHVSADKARTMGSWSG